MDCRQYGIEDGSSTGFELLYLLCINAIVVYNYVLMGDKSLGTEGGGFESSRVSVIMVCARAAPKEGVLLAYHVKPSRGFLVDFLHRHPSDPRPIMLQIEF